MLYELLERHMLWSMHTAATIITFRLLTYKFNAPLLLRSTRLLSADIQTNEQTQRLDDKLTYNLCHTDVRVTAKQLVPNSAQFCDPASHVFVKLNACVSCCLIPTVRLAKL